MECDAFLPPGDPLLFSCGVYLACAGKKVSCCRELHSYRLVSWMAWRCLGVCKCKVPNRDRGNWGKPELTAVSFLATPMQCMKGRLRISTNIPWYWIQKLCPSSVTLGSLQGWQTAVILLSSPFLNASPTFYSVEKSDIFHYVRKGFGFIIPCIQDKVGWVGGEKARSSIHCSPEAMACGFYSTVHLPKAWSRPG